MNTTGVQVKYSSSPVLFEMKKFLDEWEDSMRPLTMVYYTKIPVEYDTNYIFRVRLSLEGQIILKIFCMVLKGFNNIINI